MAFTISGTVFTDKGVTTAGAGLTVKVSVNGAAASNSGTTIANGTFSIAAVTAASGATLAIYLQGNAEVGMFATLSTNATLSGTAIWASTFIPTSMTNTQIATAIGNGDSGITAIVASATSSLCTLVAGVGLNWAGSSAANFSLSGDVTTSVGAATGTITITGSGATFVGVRNTSNLTLSGTGTVTCSQSPSVGNLSIGSGATLDASTSNFTLTVGGTWSNSGTFVPRAGIVQINGNITFADATSFNRVTFGNATGTTLGANLTCTGLLTISNGKKLIDGGFTINVAGGFTNSGGTLTATGTLNCNGTAQTIIGSTTFFNLTKTVASADTLTFTDGTTTTVSNAVTLHGAAGQLLTLAGSGVAGWTIAAPATQTLDHLSVSHSTATGNTMAAGSTSTDGGSNVNWSFGTGGAPKLLSEQLGLGSLTGVH